MAAPEHLLTPVDRLEHVISTLSHARRNSPVGALNSADGVRRAVRMHAEAQHCLVELLIECGKHALGEEYLAQYCNAVIRWAVRSLFEEDPLPSMATEDPMATTEEVLFNVAAVALQSPRPGKLFDTLVYLLRVELRTYRVAARLTNGPVQNLTEQAQQLLSDDPNLSPDEVSALAGKAVLLFLEEFAPAAA